MVSLKESMRVYDCATLRDSSLLAYATVTTTTTYYYNIGTWSKCLIEANFLEAPLLQLDFACIHKKTTHYKNLITKTKKMYSRKEDTRWVEHDV